MSDNCHCIASASPVPACPFPFLASFCRLTLALAFSHANSIWQKDVESEENAWKNTTTYVQKSRVAKWVAGEESDKKSCEESGFAMVEGVLLIPENRTYIKLKFKLDIYYIFFKWFVNEIIFFLIFRHQILFSLCKGYERESSLDPCVFSALAVPVISPKKGRQMTTAIGATAIVATSFRQCNMRGFSFEGQPSADFSLSTQTDFAELHPLCVPLCQEWRLSNAFEGNCSRFWLH